MSEFSENYEGYKTIHSVLFGMCRVIVPAIAAIIFSRFRWRKTRGCR